MNDVMDRLRAANPVLDDPALPPVESLLARLDPEPPQRQRRFKRPLVLAVAATVALAAVVLGSELRGVDVVAEAREALGSETEGIIHMRVLEESLNADGSLVSLSGTRPEVWVAHNPLRLHVLQASRSGSVVDSSYADGVTKNVDSATGKVQTNRMDPETQREFEDIDGRASLQQPGLDPVPVIRRLLAEGKLKHDGSTTFAGREVERLVGSEGGVGVEYLVDARTYAPVRFATSPTKNGKPVNSFRITFELYEVLPMTKANEALLRIPE